MRVLPADVQAIFEGELPDNVFPFIQLAHQVVAVYVEPHINEVTLNGVSSEDILTELERWLAAHFIACSARRQTQQEKVGDVSVSYPSLLGPGLAATTYGQQAMQIDPTGGLKQLSGSRVTFHAIPVEDV